MSQPVLIKVYGNLFPAQESFRIDLARICQSAMPMQDIVSLDGNLLLISFEGLYFPLEETVDYFKERLAKDQKGKLDFLDLENWRLERFIFENGAITAKSSPLNNVLDYSGH